MAVFLDSVRKLLAFQGRQTGGLQDTFCGSMPIDSVRSFNELATAIEAFASPMQELRRNRDFAAWLGLIPRRQSSRGNQILGRASKMGQRDNRRLLIVGMSSIRVALRHNLQERTCLARILARKPCMVVAIAALANKMAREIWARLANAEVYRDSKVMARRQILSFSRV